MAEAEYISKEAALSCFTDWIDRYGHEHTADEMVEYQRIEDLPAADVRPVPPGGIGEMSDGYHTFNGLYYQRMILFAALVKAYKDKAWKSWKHEDGKSCFGGGWFIVGIDTPQGSYTYHYEDKYWNWFECEELPVAKHWDGHTEEDATRLLSLDVRPVVRGKWEKVGEQMLINLENAREQYAELGYPHRKILNLRCSSCRKVTMVDSSIAYDFCPHCGADMREVTP